MLDDWKRARALKRVRDGDGRALQPFRWWQLLTGRKLFFLHLHDGSTRDDLYAVDVRYVGREGGDEGKAHLYLDGRHRLESRLPAVFQIEHGTIEVTPSRFGLKRVHFVTGAGVEHRLVPDSRSAIGRRLRFERDHPVPSRRIGALSVLLLIVGIGFNVLQLAEPISAIPPIAERVGRFESPIHLPIWLNVALGVGAVLGSMERALRMRHHWLLDALGN